MTRPPAGARVLVNTPGLRTKSPFGLGHTSALGTLRFVLFFCFVFFFSFISFRCSLSRSTQAPAFYPHFALPPSYRRSTSPRSGVVVTLRIGLTFHHLR